MTQITSSAFSTPICFARGRNGDLYGVTGQERGFRWDGVTANVEQLGISAPAGKPTLAAPGSGTATSYIYGLGITARGSGYTIEPTVTFTGGGGTGAAARIELQDGQLWSAVMLNYGTGYTSAPTVGLSGTDGTGGTVVAYRKPGIKGKYWAALRYIDDTVADKDGPLASSISELGTIEYNDAATGFSWSWSNTGMEARVSKIELWRTTADQSAVLYRVATVASSATSYTDRLSDSDLAAPNRALTCTGAASTDIITCTNHGMVDGDTVTFSNLTPTTDLSNGTKYYVRDVTETGFKVATTSGGSAVNLTVDITAGLANCTSFAALPIVLPNGQPNAMRFGVPPQNKAVMVMFQDRAWYAVDVAGRKSDGTSDAAWSEPNVLYFSEVDEPESVADQNQLVLQENAGSTDRITALMPFGGGMVVFQERHCYRLTYAAQPIIDANIQLMGQRGCLNQRCWDMFDSKAYVVDSLGMYVMQGAEITPLSFGVDTYWSENSVSWASSANFFVKVDPKTRIVRFFFSASPGRPDRALCYHIITQAWWEEQYATGITAGVTAPTGGRHRLLVGTSAGQVVKLDEGHTDANGNSIACSFRTGNMSLASGGNRSIRVLYAPTTAACNLAVQLHYNNSSSARAAAVMTNRGTGFTTDAGGHATIDLSKTRSALGDATGLAVAMYSGNVDDRSAGGDRHLAIGLSVTRPATEGVIIRGLGVEGVG